MKRVNNSLFLLFAHNFISHRLIKMNMTYLAFILVCILIAPKARQKITFSFWQHMRPKEDL